MHKRDIQHDLKVHRESDMHGNRLGPWIHDIVYGAHDGIMTTFAVVAGTAGAGLPAGIVIVLGAANLLADGVSMGAGAFLSRRSEHDQYERLMKEEQKEVETDPELEREEIREAYRLKGFTGKDLERTVEIITSNKKIWVDTMMKEEHGMIDETTEHAFLHGIATFLGFLVFGSVPLLPYFVSSGNADNFALAIVGTGLALLLVGITRSVVTKERAYRGVLEILVIGALTASIAYGVGVMLKSFAGI